MRRCPSIARAGRKSWTPISCEFPDHGVVPFGFRPAPQQVQRRARRAYRLFRDNPHHPSLAFKQVHPTRPVYSVRITLGYRAVGVVQGDEIIWYWVGPHHEYERLISTR